MLHQPDLATKNKHRPARNRQDLCARTPQWRQRISSGLSYLSQTAARLETGSDPGYDRRRVSGSTVGRRDGKEEPDDQNLWYLAFGPAVTRFVPPATTTKSPTRHGHQDPSRCCEGSTTS